MLEAIALAWAAIALSFAFFRAVMLGCGPPELRHSDLVEVIPAEIQKYETERVSSNWRRTEQTTILSSALQSTAVYRAQNMRSKDEIDS